MAHAADAASPAAWAATATSIAFAIVPAQCLSVPSATTALTSPSTSDVAATTTLTRWLSAEDGLHWAALGREAPV